MCERARQYLCPSTAIISPARVSTPHVTKIVHEPTTRHTKKVEQRSKCHFRRHCRFSFLLLFSGEPKQSEGNLDKGIAKCPSFHQKRKERSGEWGGREHVFHPISPYLCKLLLIAGPRRRVPLASHHANRAVQNYGNGTKFGQF